MMYQSNMRESPFFIDQNQEPLNKAFLTLDERNVKKKAKVFRRWLIDETQMLFCRCFI